MIYFWNIYFFLKLSFFLEILFRKFSREKFYLLECIFIRGRGCLVIFFFGFFTVLVTFVEVVKCRNVIGLGFEGSFGVFLVELF